MALAACGHDPPAPPPPAPVPAQPPSASAIAAVHAGHDGGSPAGDAVAGDAGASVEAGDAGAAPPGMVTIPAGIFLMGSPAERGIPEERPMHEVVVAAFDLDRTEVTASAYLACVAAGACKRAHEDSRFCTTHDAPVDRGNHPVSCIDFHQAEAYCAFAGKRLPSEREWEYAARGGAEERRYSWGDEDPTPERACYIHPGTCPVASFAPGAFGLYDMTGNVWEWTRTWFGSYPGEASSGRYRVYRGGSWSRRFPSWLTTTLRNRYEPDEWSASLGVRCARTRLPLVCPEDTEPRGEACVRVRGTPRCEPTRMWNGEMCTVGGGPSPGPAAAAPPLGPPPDEAPVTRTRTPGDDADCRSHYTGKPAAYRFSGATFHARNRPLEAAGCTRRVMGQTWTSACCPG